MCNSVTEACGSCCIPLKHDQQPFQMFLSNECIQVTWGHVKTADQSNQWTHQQLTSPIYNLKTLKCAGWITGPFQSSLAGGESNIWPTLSGEGTDRFYWFKSDFMHINKEIAAGNTYSAVHTISPMTFEEAQIKGGVVIVEINSLLSQVEVTAEGLTWRKHPT